MNLWLKIYTLSSQTMFNRKCPMWISPQWMWGPHLLQNNQKENLVLHFFSAYFFNNYSLVIWPSYLVTRTFDLLKLRNICCADIRLYKSDLCCAGKISSQKKLCWKGHNTQKKCIKISKIRLKVCVQKLEFFAGCVKFWG